MELTELRAALAPIPAPEVPPVDDAVVASTVAYLSSDEARASIARDTYWPKWHSPWWHLLLLHELGLAERAPRAAVEAMVAGLAALPSKIFPIRPEDRAPGADHYRDSTCHCAVGNVHQVLTAGGVGVERALPWLEPWFARYQLEDGGANCDETAYLSGEPDASSIVATVPMLEAALGRARGGDAAHEAEVDGFVERAAAFLIGRRLVDGSPSRHNAEEREAAPRWLLPTFPRFYFYDVLRGLAVLVRWADTRGRALPLGAVAPAALHLARTFPDGVVRVVRRGVDTHPTTLAFVDGAWGAHPTTSFPLLDAVSVVGAASAPLTRQWAATRVSLLALIDAGRVT